MKINALLLSACLTLLSMKLSAQTTRMVRGAVIQEGTKEKVQEAIIENFKRGLTKRTDNFGAFEIYAGIGDSLLVRKIGYQDTYYVVTKDEAPRIYLKLSNQLLEVEINGQKKVSANFEEASTAYSKEKGIFYGGKPPLALLSPFGGSPVTFFYELFSKDGKRVKRLNQLAAKARIDEEVAVRFNPTTIKAAIPIEDKDVDLFRDNYAPAVEDSRGWSDSQLIQYIKENFEKFKRKK